jgi:hypothetical protein
LLFSDLLSLALEHKWHKILHFTTSHFWYCLRKYFPLPTKILFWPINWLSLYTARWNSPEISLKHIFCI